MIYSDEHNKCYLGEVIPKAYAFNKIIILLLNDKKNNFMDIIEKIMLPIIKNNNEFIVFYNNNENNIIIITNTGKTLIVYFSYENNFLTLSLDNIYYHDYNVKIMNKSVLNNILQLFNK